MALGHLTRNMQSKYQMVTRAGAEVQFMFPDPRVVVAKRWMELTVFPPTFVQMKSREVPAPYKVLFTSLAVLRGCRKLDLYHCLLVDCTYCKLYLPAAGSWAQLPRHALPLSVEHVHLESYAALTTRIRGSLGSGDARHPRLA